MDIPNKLNRIGVPLTTVWHAALIVIPVLVIVILFTSINRYISEPQEETVQLSEPQSSAQRECITYTLSVLKLSEMSFPDYEKVWSLCGTEQLNKLYLHDFKIRRETFIRQELDERVTLAMVVAITISGVVMSGLQLFMSYRLALSGHGALDKDMEISVQKDRIALRSSMVGLMILVISLAFFVVYVKWIYTITEVPVEAPQTTQPSGRQLPMSGAVHPEQPAQTMFSGQAAGSLAGSGTPAPAAVSPQ
jgi:hypothetical protein